MLTRSVAEVERRLDISLQLNIHDQSITVAAPRENGSILRSAYPYSVSFADCHGDGVLLTVVEDGHVDRGGEPPEGMTFGDYFGTTDTLVRLRADVNEMLLSGDVESMLAWLVAKSKGQDGDKRLQHLRCVEKEDQRRLAVERAKVIRVRAARFLVFLGVMSLFYRILGPVVLTGGIFIQQRLEKSGQTEGRKAASWAIGLGILASIFLLLSTIVAIHLNHRS